MDVQAELNKLPLSQELLSYYRERLDKSEKDYQDAMEEIAKLKISHSELHQTMWQLQQREQEVAELQTALSEARTRLYDERKQVMQLNAENDELRVQEMKDRKKVQYLLSLCPIPEEETTYFKSKLNKAFVKDNNQEIPSAKLNEDQKMFYEQLYSFKEVGSEAQEQTIKDLKKQIEEQKHYYDQAIESLKRDRHSRVEEERLRRIHEAEKIKSLMEKVSTLEGFCRSNTKDLLKEKKEKNVIERRFKEEHARLVEENLGLKTQLDDANEKQKTLSQDIEVKIKKKYDHTVKDLRQQIFKYEEAIQNTKTEAEKTESSFKKKFTSLQSKISSISNNYQTLKRRRDYEIEGFTNDILLLRKQLKSMEKHILKYAPVDDVELELLKLAKNTSEKASRISSKLHDLKGKVYSAEEEMRKLKF